MTTIKPDTAPARRASVLARSIPWLTAGVGVLHTSAALTSFPEMFDPNPLSGILDDGVVGSVGDSSERHAAMWFFLAGLFLFYLGHLLRWTIRQTGRIPALMGWWLLGFGALVVVLMPASGGWFLLIVGVLALVATRWPRRLP